MKTKHILAIIGAIALFLITGIVGLVSANIQNKYLQDREFDIFSNVFGDFSSETEIDFAFPFEDFIARIDVTGMIQPSTEDTFYSMSSGEYDHNLYINLINALIDCPENKGILLYINSPGGTVYESDEMYLKLMEYKEKTSRPIYAYFGSEACSGGYYIAMAADEIYANRNTWTGSIGVIISLINYKDLAEEWGVKEIDITSGANKAMGSAMADLTDEQRAILQSLVDESYEQFTGIVAAGRGLAEETVKSLADGRIYSAKQALDASLIDYIATEEEAFRAIKQKVNLGEDEEFYTPPRDYGINFLSSLFYKAANLKEKSELELLREMIYDRRNGGLMYYAG